MQEARANSGPPAASIAEQRANADHFGDSATEPAGVGYEAVDAGGVAAEWATPEEAVTDRVLVYFHGGGYGYCSVRSHRKLVGHIASAIGCRALNVDYRLAPEHPHPAAVQDALVAYRRLLELGVEPQHVAASGDSAGGGLAAAMLVKVRDEGLPLPAAGVLISPWVDLALTGETITGNVETDLLTDLRTQHCADQFLAGQDPRDPYTGLPPLYIQVGDAEGFLDDSTRFAEKAERAGVDIRLDVFPEMQHTFQIWAGNLPEADEAIARAGEFLRSRLGLGTRVH